ncbi:MULTISPECIES: DMT family transporter [Aminobacterium]|jgi:drug/metabolite transporter (DMT)-like permease|uniref:DMT family transporter n=2 Tax=Aminobacteriaceae TaxID=3029087 RepID=UPI00257971BF|nr:DMT family transporter [Aminobacterium sp. UBA4908]
MVTSNKRDGIMFVFVASFLWGTLSPVGKILAALKTDMLLVALVRAGCVFLGGGLFLLWRDPSLFRISFKQFILVGFFSIFGVVGIYVGYFMALQDLTVATAVVVLYTYPLLTLIGSALIMKEPPSPTLILAAFLGLIGVGVTVWGSGTSLLIRESVRGFLWIFISVLGMVAYSLFGRWVAKNQFIAQESLFVYAHFLGFFWIALFYGVFHSVSLTGWVQALRSLSPAQWGWILYVGFGVSLFGYSSYFLALRTIEASTASTIATIEIVIAITLTSLFMKQLPTAGELLGSLLITIAVVLATGKISSKFSIFQQ